MSAESREQRSQTQNKKLALQKLAEKIKRYHQQLLYQEKFISNEVVRTYHEKDNRVTDHASGLKQSYTEVEKDITQMVESRIKCLD